MVGTTVETDETHIMYVLTFSYWLPLTTTRALSHALAITRSIESRFANHERHETRIYRNIDIVREWGIKESLKDRGRKRE